MFIAFCPNPPISILKLPNCLSHEWLTFLKRCSNIVILVSFHTIYSINYDLSLVTTRSKRRLPLQPRLSAISIEILVVRIHYTTVVSLQLLANYLRSSLYNYCIICNLTLFIAGGNWHKPCPETLSCWAWGHYSRICGTASSRTDKLYKFEYGDLKINFQSNGIDPGRGFVMTYFLADRLDRYGKYSFKFSVLY